MHGGVTGKAGDSLPMSINLDTRLLMRLRQNLRVNGGCHILTAEDRRVFSQRSLRKAYFAFLCEILSALCG
jgi:hypothetical protein